MCCDRFYTLNEKKILCETFEISSVASAQFNVFWYSRHFDNDLGDMLLVSAAQIGPFRIETLAEKFQDKAECAVVVMSCR